jgi:DNA-binding transcriptional LysR family regulator
MMRLHWDDLHLVLGISRAGSFAGAAVRLGVSTPTVFRKANDLERRLGTRVFHRDTTGVTLTAAGREALAVARRLEEEVGTLEARICDQDAGVAGTIRLATVDTLVAGPLLPILAQLRVTEPSLVVDLRVGVGMADLRAREADAALRAGGEPPETLVGRKLCRIAVAVYGSSAQTDACDLERAGWVTPDDELNHLASARWLREQGHSARKVMQTNSLHTLAQAVASGVGLGILPCYLADPDPRLVRIAGPIDELAGDLWFLTHPELRGTARLRALSDHVARAFQGLRSLFAGEMAQR